MLSTFIFLLSCSVLLISIRALLEVAESSKRDNLGFFLYNTLGLSELAGDLYGTKGVFVTRLFLITYQIGKSIAYLIFFIQFFSYVFSDAENE